MTLFEFAWKNVSRDKRNYLYYFANCTFSTFVFFLFSMLAFHPALKVIDAQSTMGLILVVGQAVCAAFSVCFISYSMRCFLKNRSRQLGLLAVLGASAKQMNRLIFLENMLVGILSVISGIVFGMVLSKFFLDIANQLIGVSDFTFYLPVKAMLVTVAVMGAIFLAIAYFTPKFIRKKEIIKLFKVQFTDDKPQKTVPVLAAFAASASAVLWAFAGKSAAARAAQESVALPLLFVVAVVLGTYLLFWFGMRLWIAIEMKSRCNVRLLCVGDQRARLRTNAQSMTVSAVLYAISFFAVIVLLSLSANVESETEKILPYAMTYHAWTQDADAAHDVAVIEEILQDQPGYQKTDVCLWYADVQSRSPVMSQSSYNQVMDFLQRAPIFVADDGVYLVAGNAGEVLDAIPSSLQDFFKANGLSLRVQGYTDKVITLTGFTNGICVVSDAVFETLRPQMTSKTITAFLYDEWQNNPESPQAVFDALHDTLQRQDANVVSAYQYYRSSQIQNNMTLYIGGMLSFVFLLAVASFIYSRLYSELETECRKFKAIVKLGLSEKELSIVLNRLVFLILCVPFVLALGYLWIGILVLERFTLVSNIPIALAFTAGLLAVQTALYLGIRTSYRATVLQGINQN